MAKLISLQIDVTKIDKTKLYKGKKGTYLTLTVAVNDEEDDYGNNVNCWQEQTQQERQNNEPKNYLRKSGKVIWSDDANNAQSDQATYEAEVINSVEDSDDDLPF